jgi:hypothetical protein
VKLPTITTPDGRRAYAFVAIWIGCVVFTVFAAVAVWLVSGNARYSLILGLAAHVQLFVGMGAFAFVLGRRMRFTGGRDGVTIDDSAVQDAADQVAAAAVDEAATIGTKP